MVCISFNTKLIDMVNNDTGAITRIGAIGMNTIATSICSLSNALDQLRRDRQRLIKELKRIKHKQQITCRWHNPIKIGRPISKRANIKPYVRSKLNSTKLCRLKIV